MIDTGERIKSAVVAEYPVTHPENPEINTVTFTQCAGPVITASDGVKMGQNAVVVSPGKIDRSPCGTGTSARLTVLAARCEIEIGETYLSRSLIGSEFQSQIVYDTTVGALPAIVPRIVGRAWITAHHQFTLDPTDPFPHGYTLSDTWYRALD